MIHRFRCRNYRNFKELDLEFGRINLLIGPNNCGKTNLLRALQWPATVVTQGLDAALKAEHSQDLRHHAAGKSEEVSFHQEYSISPSRGEHSTVTASYSLSLSTGYGHTWQISKEAAAWQDEGKASRCEFSCHGLEPGTCAFSYHQDAPEIAIRDVSQRESLFGQQRIILENLPSDKIKDTVVELMYHWSWFHNFRLAHFPSVQFKKIRVPVQKELDEFVLGKNFSNLINVVYNYDRTFPSPGHDFLDVLVHELQEIFPALRKIKIFDYTESLIGLRFYFGDRYTLFEDLSDGSTMMVLLKLLLSPEGVYSTLMLDEPEISLHPAWLRVLSHWMIDFKSAPQIFVTTHSPDLLDGFTEEYRSGRVKVFVFNTQGEAKDLPASHLDAFFNQGWELGDLYRSGEPELGGWPW